MIGRINAHIVKIANMAQLVNVIAPIFTSERGLFLQTIYYPLQMFATNCRGQSLELFHDGPKYATRRFGDVPYLDSSATYADGRLVLNVVNRHPQQALEAEIQLEDKAFAGEVEVWEVNGPDIKAENDFDSTRVKAVQQPALRTDGSRLHHAFAPHSYTMLKGRIA